MQIAGHDADELMSQVKARAEYRRVDQRYFDDALTGICNSLESTLGAIDEVADRPIGQLDPVETGILLLGYYELNSRPEVPYRVVIDEAVNLAKRFGAQDGHKYVNALLDRLSRNIRATERG